MVTTATDAARGLLLLLLQHCHGSRAACHVDTMATECAMMVVQEYTWTVSPQVHGVQQDRLHVPCHLHLRSSRRHRLRRAPRQHHRVALPHLSRLRRWLRPHRRRLCCRRSASPHLRGLRLRSHPRGHYWRSFPRFCLPQRMRHAAGPGCTSLSRLVDSQPSPSTSPSTPWYTTTKRAPPSVRAS